jgi:hypothetical protein
MSSKDTIEQTECKGTKFARRKDLTPEKRLQIAYMALQGVWGVITQLSREFMISRTFIYKLMKDLKKITETVFGKCKKHFDESIKQKAISLILCLRLEGRCSINSISQILKRIGISKYNAVGSISQILTFAGNSLSNTLVNEDSDVKVVIIASDEIFSHLRPILMTVEPVSSTILRIELADSRKIEVWKKHWECIDKSGYIAVYLVNDEGKSMSGAQKEVLVNVIRQSDTFHGFAHRLGSWVDRLENLNTSKNHITQGILNLFMHYHNHRRYVAGKRKGKTPFEILSNRKQEKDWLELLIEKVPWNKFGFLKTA